jgi:uncharacterized protein
MIKSTPWRLCAAILLILTGSLKAKEIPARPSTLVNDYAGVLASEDAKTLERKLVAYADSTSTQIAVVIETSLEGEEVFDYSLRIAEQWGIGNREKDNGILIFVAIEDRKIFIHTGMGVQDYLTDNVTKRMIDNIIRPAFRQGDYYGGLDRATTAIIDLGAGRFSNDLEADGKQEGSSDGGWFVILVIIIAVFILFSFLSRFGGGDDHGGGYYRGGHYGRRRGGGWIFIPGPGGSWGGGSSGSDWGGGDFGGFGGGGFDGGGAGGDW